MPHLAHATMEPPAATARIANGKCEVWGCFQSPQAARDLVAKRLGMSADDVTVHVTLLGGGFGRKSKPDFGVEAARALEGDGRQAGEGRRGRATTTCTTTTSTPCRSSIWRPGVDAQGKPVAWLHRTRRADDHLDLRRRGRSTRRRCELGMGVINVPFAIPNIRIENPEAVAHTRIGWFRSVSNIPHAFAVQSFVAELAAAAGRDPKDYPARGDRPAAPDQSGRRWATPGTTASRPSATRSTPAGCGA